jgi:beta propeller repeat protein
MLVNTKVSKTILTCFLVALLSLVFRPLSASASITLGSSTQLSQTGYESYDPATYNNYLVYQQYDDTWNGDIHLVNKTTGSSINITDSADNDDYSPDINGNYVVYNSLTLDGDDIYLYNISTTATTKLSTTGSAYYPVVYGDNVVWIDSNKVYLHNITSGITSEISSGTSTPIGPRAAIYDNIVAYEFNQNIYMYNITNGITTTVANSASEESKPSVYGDYIAYTKYSGATGDIYLYKISTAGTTNLTNTASASEILPRIYGNYVLYTQGTTYSDLAYYDISEASNTTLTTHQKIYSIDFGRDYIVYTNANDVARYYSWSEPDLTPPTGSISSSTSIASTPADFSLSATDNESDVSGMRFSNNGTDWSDWESYSASKSWDFTDPTYGGTSYFGTKTVYAMFRNEGNLESEVSSVQFEYISSGLDDGTIDTPGANGSVISAATSASMASSESPNTLPATGTGDKTIFLTVSVAFLLTAGLRFYLVRKQKS